MILKENIIQDGHPTLNLVAKEVSFPLSDEMLNLANELMEYLEVSMDDEQVEKLGIRPGVGLAAPQVNESVRMFAILNEDEEGFYPQIYINPKIISHTEKMSYLEAGEGCLSVDDEIKGHVPRYFRVTVEAYDLDGNKFRQRLTEFYSIVFQHEFDHLNGVLFTSKITTNVEGLIAI